MEQNAAQISFIKNANNRTKQLRPYTQHLVLHEPSLQNESNARLMLQTYEDLSNHNIHGIIDPVEVLITLPLGEVGLHVGFPANQCSEGYKLVSTPDRANFQQAWNRAVNWFAQRTKDHGWQDRPLAEHILSNHEVLHRYNGTPPLASSGVFARFGKTMDDFRQDVANALQSKQPTENDPRYAPSQSNTITPPATGQLSNINQKLHDALTQVGPFGQPIQVAQPNTSAGTPNTGSSPNGVGNLLTAIVQGLQDPDVQKLLQTISSKYTQATSGNAPRGDQP